jgi:hypothetical protein
VEGPDQASPLSVEVGAGARLDAAARRREFGGVGQQVPEHPADAWGVGQRPQLGPRRGRADSNVQADPCAEGADSLDGVVHQRLRSTRGQVELESAGVHARQVQQLGDQLTAAPTTARPPTAAALGRASAPTSSSPTPTSAQPIARQLSRDSRGSRAGDIAPA